MFQASQFTPRKGQPLLSSPTPSSTHCRPAHRMQKQRCAFGSNRPRSFPQFSPLHTLHHSIFLSLHAQHLHCVSACTITRNYMRFLYDYHWLRPRAGIGRFLHMATQSTLTPLVKQYLPWSIFDQLTVLGRGPDHWSIPSVKN